jgi:hypothetical protein
MKSSVIILAFVSLFQTAKGQDTIKHFEFGSTIITVNSLNTTSYFARDKAPVEFINGLFFRYTNKRFGFRAHASYSENYCVYATPANWSDGSSGEIHNREFRIGIGGQYTLLKKKDWFYTLADLSFRTVFADGFNYGGFSGASDSFSSKAKGLDSFLGLGFKIKTFKNVYLSPEIGYNISCGFINYSTTSLTSGKKSNTDFVNVNINPIAKLHLSVRF